MHKWDYKIIAVDFDGCLCASEWPGVGEPNMPLINALRGFRERGHKVILWSCRTEKYLEDALSWCANYGLYFDAVNANLPEMNELYGNDCRKIGADIYIDDRAMKIVCKPNEVTSVDDLLDMVYG